MADVLFKMDYREVAGKLRRKAADPAVSPAERESLLEKAAELEDRYGPSSHHFSEPLFRMSSPQTTDLNSHIRDIYAEFEHQWIKEKMDERLRRQARFHRVFDKADIVEDDYRHDRDDSY